MTRSKAKLIPPIDWEQQNDTRELTREAVQNEQAKYVDKKSKKKEKEVKDEVKVEGKLEELFQELMTTPTNFTLDQLLSLVPIFKDRFLSATRQISAGPVVKQLEDDVEAYQIFPRDVNFTIPTVKVEWNGTTVSPCLA